ncbi:SAM-dependent methyltransferase [Gulosibacter molinativorax]|uniref:Methyltransferase domain-containing protein n=1 Tax=Gulosibacter molinativorax TaxID=256821 RepID=A0ABT7C5Z9_9MICO|nr:SAM-dependent methyltransferase [Gulosibacter molinativorax]MDJ1370608.1 methyltransferase domain-containing protein [Gulosibacter molinativorax]QUY61978.1 NADH dehydrogenase [Gulosibacter molinativorax]
MTTTTWDAIVIGGGAAGLSAALALGRSRRRTLVIDGGLPRNRFADHAHNILGLDGVPPLEIVRTGREQAGEYGVEFLEARVAGVTERERGVRVQTAEGDIHEARAAVVTTGLTDILPDISGLRSRWGKTVLHCPYCHGWEVRDGRLGVLVLSEFGFHQAQMIRQWSDDLTVFLGDGVRLPEPLGERLRARGIRIVESPITEVLGEGDTIDEVRTASGESYPLDAIFTFGQATPNDGFLADLELTRNDTPLGSFIAVDATGKTSANRVWAAGNVVNPGAAVPQAAGDAAFAAAQLNMALVEEDFDLAVAASNEPSEATADYWNGRYGEKPAMWSGRPNATLVDVVADLAPGAALDLGSGEGADVVWLASQGWDALGLDISSVAVARAEQAAAAFGASAAPDTSAARGRASFRVVDLASPDALQLDERFDLVTASFLHSTLALPRTEILRSASELVGQGGHLLVITHAAPPPWFGGADQAEHEHKHKHKHKHNHHHTFLSPEQELEALALDPASWRVVIAEARIRSAMAPDGAPAELEDGVLLLQRS